MRQSRLYSQRRKVYGLEYGIDKYTNRGKGAKKINILTFDRLLCGECRRLVKYNDRIYLDVMNTIRHARCFDSNYVIKDSGTFYEIINKYSFFSDLKPKGIHNK